MIGVVDVGGGLRGAYGAGVFDYCLENDITFDFCAGVSAGSANIASYIAKQMGRNYIYYTDYTFRQEYMSLHNYLHTGNYIGLDYIYGALSGEGGEYPLDSKAIHESEKQFLVVATDAQTGEPFYFTKKDYFSDNLDFVKASCCVPVINQPYQIGAHAYFDGGLSDPIPYQKCLDAGCEKVVVILTRPRDYVRTSNQDERLSLLLRRKYPAVAKKLCERGEVYNRQLEECKKLEEEGKVLIIAPESIGEMKTLTKDRNEIKALYVRGFHDGAQIANFLKRSD